MRSMTSAYRAAKDAQQRPIIFVMITTVRTRYIFSDVWLTDAETERFGNVDFWNGVDATAGDGGYFGAIPASYSEARVLAYGSVRETLAPQQQDLIASFAQTEIGAYSVSLDNADSFFSALLGDNRNEPLLNQELTVYQGFKGIDSADFLPLFPGNITQLTLSGSDLRLVAENTSVIRPDREQGDAVTILALEDDGLGTMAEDTVAHSALSGNFLAADAWVFKAQVRKDALSAAGVIFEIRDGTYNAIRMQIGIDASNQLYLTTGQNLTTTPTTATYANSGYPLTSAAINRAIPVYVRVWNDGVNDCVDLYWGEASQKQTHTGITLMDRSDTGAANTVTIGEGYDGKVRSIVWNDEEVYYVNADGDNTLTDMPDIINGALDLPRVDGVWATWP